MNDVCLLLEGTYPYVAGGVSSWVYDLIKRMNDISFSIVYLGAHRSVDKKKHYEIPDNVTDFREFYIFDYDIAAERRPRARSRAGDFKALEDFLGGMQNGDPALFDDLLRVVGDADTRTISLDEFVRSYRTWEMLERVYAKEAKGISFIDYFWTWRFIYLPFFSLLKYVLPRAKLYHAVSTGYAGIMGAMAKMQHNRPFIITEHGIYTRERKIEVSQADWIYSENARDLKVTEGKDFFKDWWMNLFSFFSRVAYEKSDKIITLFEGNRKIEIEEGAEAAKTNVIPNGIKTEKFKNFKKELDTNTLRVGFMGRVVPIKDLKTFIRASRIVYDELKNVEIYIMGPTDEDEGYYKECAALVETEGLGKVCFFTGKVKVMEYYPKLDVLVLTSISEGQPIVILEAHACGIPVVATDVGACSELLYGSQADDRLLGASGIITPICSPEATAQAIIKILKDKELHRKMSEVARKRVEMYYQLDSLIAKYRAVYSRYMDEVRWQA